MAIALRILLVEDSVDDAELVLRELQRHGYGPQTRRVETADALRAALATGVWDIVIADHTLPHFDGFEALMIVREHDPLLPFILVSGTIGEELAVAAMKSGAQDYLMKDRLARLGPAVTHALHEARTAAAKQRAEQEGQQAEARYRTTLDHMLEGCQIIGHDWRYLYVNDEAARQGHRHRDELIGRTMMEIYPGIEHTPMFAELHRCMQERQPRQLVNLFTYPDGEIGWFDLHMEPVPEGVFILSADITAVKRAEQTMADLAARNRALADISGSLSAVTSDYQATLDLIVRRVSEILGDACLMQLVADDGQSLDMAAIYHPDQATAANLRQINSSARMHIHDGPAKVVFRTHEPLLIPVVDPQALHAAFRPEVRPLVEALTHYSTLCAPLRTQGRVIGMLIVVRITPDRPYTENDKSFAQDLADRAAMAISNAGLFSRMEQMVAQRTTELEQANLALNERTARLQGILNTVVDGVITINEQGLIETFNPAAERIFGHSASEVVDSNVNLLMPEPYRSKHDSYLERYRSTRQARVIDIGREVIGLRKDGATFPLDLAVSKMVVGGNTYFIGIVRDITERKRIEESLIAARNEAQRANTAKDSFLATMSHEIRTPMNGVIGMIDVLHQTSLKGYQVEMVDLIRESAYSLLDIIEDILDFSKIEAGRLEIESAPLSVAEVVEKACGMLDQLALRKGVDLTLYTDPAIPDSVMGDAVRLRQILVNLTSNAIKFSSGRDRPGRVSVRAVLIAQHESHATVGFRITDNGIGMDEATQARLFTAFTQADASTTRRFGGTGLGLIISRHLANLMEGDISVQSTPDMGSTFIARLNFFTTADTPREQLPSPVHGLTCVVVGDQDGLAADMASYLTASDAIVRWAGTLAAARALAAELPPGQCVWLIDAGDEPVSNEALSEIAGTRPDLGCHFVVIGRGKRRRPRRTTDGRVRVDGNVLTRKMLLISVALAAGRLNEEQETAHAGLSENHFRPPLREEALQQGRLILVAEDNETNQKVILRQLALLGYAADVVGNGHEALQRWESGDYALLLTDLHMPEMDGYELSQAIRKLETGDRHTPIIALTANALKGEAEHCRSAGMNDYLNKPAPLAALGAMLEKWLPAASAHGRPAHADADKAGPVDIHVLEDLVGSDPAVIRRLLDDYRSTAAAAAAQLKEACRNNRPGEAGDMAHKLKSSSRAVGATMLGELCEEMEHAGKAGRMDTLTTLLPLFEVEMTAVNDYLDTLHGNRQNRDEQHD